MSKYLILLFGLMVMCIEAFSQVNYVVAIQVLDTEGCLQLNVNLKNNGSSLFSETFMTGDFIPSTDEGKYWRIVSLPADLSNLKAYATALGDGACCAYYQGMLGLQCGEEVDLELWKQNAGQCTSWSRTNSWEVYISIYKYESPDIINNCSSVNVDYTRYCNYFVNGSSLQWQIKRNSSGWQPFGSWSSTTSVSKATVINVFGSWARTDQITVRAIDGTVALPPSETFQLKDNPPAFTITENKQKICTSEGGIRIALQNPPLSNVRVYIRGADMSVPEGGQQMYSEASLATKFFELTPQSYTIQVENYDPNDAGNDCRSEQNFVVTGIYPSVTIQNTVVNETCYNPTDHSGSISLTAGGAETTAPYTYTWQHGPSGSLLSNLAGDQNYTVNVTDDNGCLGNATIWVEEPDRITVSTAYMSHEVDCHPSSTSGTKNNGSLTIEASGGTGSLQYSLDGLVYDRNYQTASLFTTLQPDNYTIYVRDQNNCISPDHPTVPVTSPSVLQYTSVLKQDVECGGQLGSIQLQGVTGGTLTGYNYTLRVKGSGLPGISQSTPAFSNLSANTYNVTIRDANNCTIESPDIIISSNGVLIDVIEKKMLTCHNSNDGSITISLQGGQSPYTITWPNGQSGLTANNLAPGTHTVTVRDGGTCIVSEAIEITAPPAIGINAQVQSPTCAGDNDGSITVDAFGGNGNFTYAWTGNIQGPTRTHLSPGTYNLTATDGKGCFINYSATLPEAMTVDLGADRSVCAGQGAHLISNIEGTSYSWTSPNGFSSSFREVTIVEPGVYKLIVTDLKGCISEDEITLSESNELLTADFLMISQAHAKDTIVIIDISWPAPDQVDWQLPAGAMIVNNDGPFAEIVFEQAGEYAVTLNAQLGGCTDDFIKLITILEQRSTNPGGREASAEGFIHNVQVYPNPSDGKFDVSFDLQEEAIVYAAILTIDGSRVLYRLKDQGASHYHWNIIMPSVSAGVYYLIIQSNNATKVVRVVKN